MAEQQKQPGKRRLVFVEDLSEQVANLEKANAQITGTAEELRSVLTELVGHTLDEQHPEDKLLVLGSIHLAA